MVKQSCILTKKLQIFLQNLGQGSIARNGQMEAVSCVVWAKLAFLVQKSIVEIDKLDIHVGVSQLTIGLIESLNLFIAADIDRALVGWSFIDGKDRQQADLRQRIVTRNLLNNGF